MAFYVANGALNTGDLVRSDENGFLTITGRLKELIIRGGQNIAPAAIDELVNTFEAALDCAVLAYCRAQLSAYKIPHVVQLIAEIPRTGSGEIIRYTLRELMNT